MAFAPPRPQSIFGRSAPPAPQIDWRLGAQVGQNIGGGIQSAIASVTKGWEKFQEAKLKKATQEEGEKALIAMGASPEDAKGFSKHPAMTQVYHTIKLAQEKAEADAARQNAADLRQIAAQQLAQQKFGLEKDRLDIAKTAASQQTAQHEVDMGTRVREIAADITYMDAKGEVQIDPFELSRIHPALQKALLRMPRSELKTIEEDKGAYESMMKKARLPRIEGEDTFTAEEHKAWASLDANVRMRLTNERPTKVIIGGEPEAIAWGQLPGNDPLPKGRGIILDAFGNFKGQFLADTESQGRFKQFEQALRDAKDDPKYQLTEKEVNAYFLAEQTMNVEDLSNALYSHIRDPDKRAQLLELAIRSKLDSGGGGGGGGGGKVSEELELPSDAEF